MVDSVRPSVRSWIMSRVKSRDTGPELLVRKLLYSSGFRYRLHVAKIPGRPDIVMRSRSALIFINGCFWHGHECKRARLPTTNRNFWQKKIKENISRDVRNHALCRLSGWRVLVVWECALRGKGRLSEERLSREIITWLEREVKRPSVKQIKGRKVA